MDILVDDRKELLANLAKNLRRFRKEKSLTQEDCSYMADISLKYW